ncbi:hypothetical protein PRUPE_8G146300 [Prunus persica]|uniref:Uncharacterized protein n=1 Tax=Prunus persica TaxID=3760 RepID=A0A251N145_PRUPE|nr:hypothetical protein PRUPE_8G146300 [Prunus persica]
MNYNQEPDGVSILTVYNEANQHTNYESTCVGQLRLKARYTPNYFYKDIYTSLIKQQSSNARILEFRSVHKHMLCVQRGWSSGRKREVLCREGD